MVDHVLFVCTPGVRAQVCQLLAPGRDAVELLLRKRPADEPDREAYYTVWHRVVIGRPAIDQAVSRVVGYKGPLPSDGPKYGEGCYGPVE